MLKAIMLVAALTVLPFATGIAEAHDSECAEYGSCGESVQLPLPAPILAIMGAVSVGVFLIYAAKKMTTPPKIGYC